MCVCLCICQYTNLIITYLFETYSYSHDISNVVTTVNTVSGAEPIVKKVFPSGLSLLSSSIAYLSVNGTHTFNILAAANRLSANVTRFRIIASSYIFILFYFIF